MVELLNCLHAYEIAYCSFVKPAAGPLWNPESSHMGEITIELKDLQFYSFHGLYEEEKLAGGEFVVNLSVKLYENNTITSIEQTVNYAALYSLVKEEMSQPRELLETLAQSIAAKIHNAYSSVKEIDICIEKKNPPITGFTGSVAVRWKREY